ncbi:hypothetical protein AAFF_G00131330 [Aldrovandia affinis]|uniref:Uncharacterized protein n=1 Tax=Aldrovandia affinis TaxID=143900 RepID=A0AAD7WAD0_9TELE|nr:hypothetical protein AAFF_G00131330 [Aldrovandia affinis]
MRHTTAGEKPLCVCACAARQVFSGGAGGITGGETEPRADRSPVSRGEGGETRAGRRRGDEEGVKRREDDRQRERVPSSEGRFRNAAALP